MFGLLVLVGLILVVAVGHYLWRSIASKSQERGLHGFIQKFDIADEHKDLLRASALSLENLHFLAAIFTKSGEFEKAIQIYLIALEKTRDKDEQEAIFVDLAELYFKAGFLQKSAEVLLNALNLRPRNEKALKLLKIVYLRLKKYDEVLQCLDALFELGFEVRQERAFIEVMKFVNLAKNSVNLAKISSKNSPETDENLGENSMLNLGKNSSENFALNLGESENSSENSSKNSALNLSKNSSENSALNLSENSTSNSSENSVSNLSENSALNLNENSSENSNSKPFKTLFLQPFAKEIAPKLYENNDLVKRYLLEHAILRAHARFELVLDVLYKQKEAIFLDDDAYFELFCAMNLAPKRENYAFANKKLQMLSILREAKFAAKLGFSYVCKHCKNQMPIFFYNCPICYEFGGCDILCEVKCEEV